MRKARVLLDFIVIAMTWEFQVKFPAIVTPNVLSCLHNSQIATMDGIGGCNRVPFPSDDDLTVA